MKITNSCFNEKQIDALNKAGIKIEFDKELSQDDYDNLAADLIDEVAYQTDTRNFDEKHQDFWHSLWADFEKFTKAERE